MKTVAMVQSNYIPWKGYFDMIAAVDEFILLDDFQYTRRDWRNRNMIKTPNGLLWLTVPVSVKGKYLQKINETEINEPRWAMDHWRTLEQNYRRAACFGEIAAWLEPLYLAEQYTHLSALNRRLIEAVCAYLGITTVISSSSDYQLIDGMTERLADLCVQAGASEYISGPMARNYIEEEKFTARDIKLRWFDYDGYAEYPQLWGTFAHNVSVLDLLFNCGREAPRYMRHVQN
jgi:hypothetical protein